MNSFIRATLTSAGSTVHSHFLVIVANIHSIETVESQIRKKSRRIDIEGSKRVGHIKDQDGIFPPPPLEPLLFVSFRLFYAFFRFKLWHTEKQHRLS